MDKKEQILQLTIQQGVLPLYFNKDEEVSINVLKALYEAGIRTVEYTNRGEAALNNFKVLRKVCDTELSGMYLGIGTIKNGEQAKAFVDAGADYLISPGVVEEAAKVAEQNNLPYVPGAMTPTEIIRAENMGCKLVKIFPGNIVGPGFVSAIRELFSGLNFIITGGVEPEEGNLRGWFQAGASAVGMGSKLITKKILEDKDYGKITELTKDSLKLIELVRK
ncbi:bifunctional 4-hydroxy-2-oxoglutarate aldolase/2-dehydro-3-deoxy-phosphogluconate aldolase [Aridibaculum aurantiacum]|uniref:bifunctional 4-hydroxy-2-oxoglutarate aldolase/2-dehydro-3-deoxy-phosphogluconate aldolase n=1 Tax=Aridibaculum aurantiacum TaxID=2810307 RepID=UPI001A971FC9|nr:bifunctional 4-hydroxy-2-oxoglutarate aldolase/2-dehydro-3-deoxy-phosphogluconate aldolase [Aridibaculum aurantiacum]